MRHRILALWLAYALMVALTFWNWHKTESILNEIEDQNCALAGLELVATEFLLLPDTPDDDDLERRAGLVVRRLESLCGELDR